LHVDNARISIKPPTPSEGDRRFEIARADHSIRFVKRLAARCTCAGSREIRRARAEANRDAKLISFGQRTARSAQPAVDKKRMILFERAQAAN
jgi:hypothetical protein